MDPKGVLQNWREARPPVAGAGSSPPPANRCRRSTSANMGLVGPDTRRLRNKISDDGLLSYFLSSCGGLRYLNLSDNKFAGKTFIDVFTELAVLDLSVNSISGEIPANFFSAVPMSLVVGKLISLKELRLAFNNLTGDVPLPDLTSSSSWKSSILAPMGSPLADNYISGSIPADLGNCTNLQSLDLSFNDLVGEVPLPVCGKIPESFTNADLIWVSLRQPPHRGDTRRHQSPKTCYPPTGNQLLSGNIPREIGSWPAISARRRHPIRVRRHPRSARQPPLGELLPFHPDIYRNNRIPYQNNGSMIYLDLSYNQLTGQIPPPSASRIFSKFSTSPQFPHRLHPQLLRQDDVDRRSDLSYNHLTGPIPDSSELLASFLISTSPTTTSPAPFRSLLRKSSSDPAGSAKCTAPDSRTRRRRRQEVIHVTSQGDRKFTARWRPSAKSNIANLVPLLSCCKVGEERLLSTGHAVWQPRHGPPDTAAREPRASAGPEEDCHQFGPRASAFLPQLHPAHHHRDMKSSNVLIDENLEACVSDFGMARLVNALDTHLSVSTLAGTPGYVPPSTTRARCNHQGRRVQLRRRPPRAHLRASMTAPPAAHHDSGDGHVRATWTPTPALAATFSTEF
ncbi:hypothetical protein HPP92_023479 [Vanilla planifolia]|uniref:Protein kinase domain-containing protein n=1 Tax=Vanilla planifolia TaxID=51239 RepID=A0A835PKP2_VANPL|nr:hypothetical protein HPP92_023479 [Vanilla planifolia]